MRLTPGKALRPVAFVVSLGALACGGEIAANPSQPANHWIVAVDLSASLRPAQLQESRTFVMGLADAVRNGDAVTVFRVYERGLAESNYMWQSEIAPAPDPQRPRPSDSLALTDFRDELIAEADVVFDPAVQGKLMGTDLFATMQRAADVAKDDAARSKVLLIVSDMLHSTPAMNMERAVPDTGWIASVRAQGLIPDLTNVCVGIVGVDPTTARGSQARAFWLKYFENAGAELKPENYRNYARNPKGMECSNSARRVPAADR